MKNIVKELYTQLVKRDGGSVTVLVDKKNRGSADISRHS